MFDVMTIAAVADELAAELVNGRVQRLSLADPRTLVAEVYARGRRRTLMASADDARPRLLLTDAKPSIDPQLVTPFVLLLRKYVRGSVVVAIDQPPLERLVRISIAKRPRSYNGAEEMESGPIASDSEAEDEEDIGEEDAVFVHLTVEIMGRHSNLILVDDDGRIMESVKRVTPSMSRVRPVMPRLPYLPPPPPNKLDPRRITTRDVEPLLEQANPTASVPKALVSWFRGVSPQMAREVAFRAAGQADATFGALPDDAAVVIARETRRLLEPLLTSAWESRVYRDANGEGIAFSAVPMEHLSAVYESKAVESISRAAEEAGMAESPTTTMRHAPRRERLAAMVRDARARAANRLSSMRQQEAKAAESEQWRTWGELIYAYLWKIQPGAATVDADGVVVPLDAELSPKENAKEYFERYRKAQSAGERLPELTRQAQAEVDYLDQLLTQANQAESFTELEALYAEWDVYHGPSKRDAERQQTRGRATQFKRPSPLLDRHGNAIFIGRSGAQNDLVTFDIAGPNDTWLHARGVPGSHVIIRWNNAAGEEDEETLNMAASLAAHYSAARESGGVEVDITRRRYVRKIKGAGPGMVTYRNERTVHASALSEADLGKPDAITAIAQRWPNQSD
ncbi:MAG: Rqc2 family fibronectin-binding protein [Thermomicrobiales bacterium]